MSARTDVLLWAQRVIARKAAPAHQVLEIASGASLEAAQEAFHKIARLAHPDLHRTTLSPEELELVTTAYSRAAAAYQEIRARKAPTTRMQTFPGAGSDPALVPPAALPTASSPNRILADDQPVNPAQAMTAKALLYYRKAERCLQRGELTAAVLQLKMAIASDPQSQFLRTALAEVQAGVAKPP
jgi:hypothetical protein